LLKQEVTKIWPLWQYCCSQLVTYSHPLTEQKIPRALPK